MINMSRIAANYWRNEAINTVTN